jgi:hypothetical protein
MANRKLKKKMVVFGEKMLKLNKEKWKKTSERCRYLPYTEYLMKS